jgi:hypothetical protein
MSAVSTGASSVIRSVTFFPISIRSTRSAGAGGGVRRATFWRGGAGG